MTKPGRNQPCPCGSGKKYKLCCLASDKAAQSAPNESPSPGGSKKSPTTGPSGLVDDEDLDQLDARSNRVVHLIQDGRLDEAQAAAHELLKTYPGFMDGHLRLATVYEARDQPEDAAAHYRHAAACLGDDCEELRADFLRKADELAPAG